MTTQINPSAGLPAIINLLRASIYRYIQLSSPPGNNTEPVLDGEALSTLGFSFAALGRLVNACVETSSPLSEFESDHAEARRLTLLNFHSSPSSKGDSSHAGQ